MDMKKQVMAITAALFLSGVAMADDAGKPKMEWSKPVVSPLTKEVKAACEAKDDVNQAYCYGVLLGLYDSNFYLSDAMEAQGLCIPESTTAAQMRDAFLDMTNKRSDQLEGPISIFYYMAMDGEFPCKSAKATASKPKK